MRTAGRVEILLKATLENIICYNYLIKTVSARFLSYKFFFFFFGNISILRGDAMRPY